MISTTQRLLVNLDILLNDLEVLKAQDYASTAHVKLLRQVEQVLSTIEDALQNETVSSYQQAVASVGLENALIDKRMPTIYKRLINYVLQYWSASLKIEDILICEFDNNADKRLELLQVKAIKAKSQFKTVAMAMGKTDYVKFLTLLSLKHEDWL